MIEVNSDRVFRVTDKSNLCIKNTQSVKINTGIIDLLSLSTVKGHPKNSL